MKKRFSIIHPLTVFILAQLAWLSLVGLWIYWYVSNYIILKQVEAKFFPQMVSRSINIMALVWGLILLVLVLGGMYFVFIYLAKQINITKLYDSFVANVSHELKSPLTSIQMYLETLSLRKVPQNKQAEFLELMKKDARRLENLINTILDISIIEQKNIAYDYRVYSAEEVVKTLAEDATEQFKLPREAIKITGNARCKCYLDRDAFKIVFHNLIDNAIKYTIGPFQIILQLECTPAKFVLKFIDKGIGIPLKHQKKIFDKFHRLGGQNIPNISGTGLGLYIVREIIKSHRGIISVFSGGDNKGSTFKIELPIYQSSKNRFIKKLFKKAPIVENSIHEE